MKTGKNRKTFFGYGIAGFGDSAFYNFISSFLLFFLTSVVHIPTVAAGVITSVGSVTDALWCPVMGHISDNHVSSKGRRRPFILLGSILCMAATVLLFWTMPAGTVVRCIYYGLLVMAFWISYSTFFVPYMAFGAEIVSDYNQRTTLRTFASFFNSFGSLAGVAMPTFIVACALAVGATRQTAWFFVGITIGVLSFVSILIGWKMTKGYDSVRLHRSGEKKHIKAIAVECVQVLKIKPLRILLLGSIISLFAYTIMTSGRMYLLTYNMGYSEGKSTLVFLISTVMWMANTPLILFIGKRLEKRGGYILCCVISIIVAVIYGFKGVSGFGDLMIFIGFTTLGTSAYWQLFPSMMYDISEVDEYINGTRREGSIVSLQALSEAIAAALAVLLMSIVLHMGGYDGLQAVQSAQTQGWILALNTLFPAFFFGCGILCLSKYPLNKRNHELLKDAIANGIKASDDDPRYQELKKLL